jgi:cell division protein FtsW
MRGNTERKEVDWILAGALATLLLVGLAYLYSAIIAKSGASDLVQSVLGGGNILNKEFAYQLTLGIGLGGLVAFGLYKLDYHQLFKYSSAMMWGLIGLLAIIAIPVIITTIYTRITGGDATAALKALSRGTGGFLWYANNSIRWIKIGFTVQPAEVAKLVILIFLAAIIDKYKELNLVKFGKPLALIGASLIMILIQPDLGSVVVLSVIILAGLWVAGVKVRYFAGLLTLVTIIGAIFAITASYRNVRVVTWVYQNFCRDISLVAPPPVNERQGVCKYFEFTKSNVDAYQTEQIRSALSRGGLTGVGYNNGDLKTIIPEVSTDGIIGVVGEESGMLMVLFILALYAVIFMRGIKIASEAPDKAGQVLATGISVWIAFQAIWNITGMTGMIPMKGLTLPFISEGNSSMIISLAAIGILLNISTQKGYQSSVANPRKLHNTGKKFVYR